MQKIHLTPGQSVISSSGQYYKVVSELGYGGNSSAFLVLCTSGKLKGILFSLKVFCNIDNKERVTKFLYEIDFLEKIDHPAISRVYDKGIYYNIYPFVVSEYYPNTLADVMKAGASLIDKLIYVINLLSGLHFLAEHETKIVHRDIKPQNIFIKGRNAILGDFGLMKILSTEVNVEDEVKEIETSASAGMAFFYRTPDLVNYLNSKSQLTQMSDIFQLGLVVAHLFTGFNPCIKADKLTDDFKMHPLGNIPSVRYGGLIAQNIKTMLEVELSNRIGHQKALDKWSGTLEDISKDLIDINGSI
jgi:serine/threonine protein kinase